MPNREIPAPAATRRRPRALPTLAMIAAVALCVWAARWQQDRMHAKEALAAQLARAQQLAPLDLAGLPEAADWSALRYRQLTAAGEYRGAAQILIDNRVHRGRAGYHVVAPLALADGRIVLVNRGWIAQGPSRAQLPEVPAPSGPVVVTGRVAIPEAGYLELAPPAPAGPVWQNLDTARFAAAAGMRVLPIVIEQTRAPEPDDGLVRDWPAPDFGVEKHRIYMVQWYAFAALALGLWGAFTLRGLRVRDG
jgi:surfeit locus 1 family protein